MDERLQEIHLFTNALTDAVMYTDILQNSTVPIDVREQETRVAYATRISWTVVPPFLIIFGVLGNIVTLIVLRRKDIGFASIAPYLRTLAIADISVLVTGLTWQWMHHGLGIKDDVFRTFGCKLRVFGATFSTDISVWTVVIMTLERFVCVLFPFKARFLNTKHRIVIISTVLVLFFCINVHFLIGFELVVNATNATSPTSYCGVRMGAYMHFLSYTWIWIDLFKVFILPFVVITACNISILKTIYALRKHGILHIHNKSYRNDTGHQTKTENTEEIGMSVELKPTTVSEFNGFEKDRRVHKTMTILVLILNTFFVITTCPICVFYIYSRLAPLPPTGSDEPVDPAFMIVCLLLYLNFTVNFLLYCLAGRRFRLALRRSFRCKYTSIIH